LVFLPSGVHFLLPEGKYHIPDLQFAEQAQEQAAKAIPTM
jgi:hypothetical protein